MAFTLINSFVIVIHLIITAKPFRLLHVYMSFLLSVVYIAFTAVYQSVTEEYGYRLLDWDQVFITSGVSAGIVLIYVPFVHLVVYCIVRARTKIGRSRKTNKKRESRHRKRNRTIHPASGNVPDSRYGSGRPLSSRFSQRSSSADSSTVAQPVYAMEAARELEMITNGLQRSYSQTSSMVVEMCDLSVTDLRNAEDLLDIT